MQPITELAPQDTSVRTSSQGPANEVVLRAAQSSPVPDDLHRTNTIDHGEKQLITAFKRFEESLTAEERKDIETIGKRHEIGLASFMAMAKIAPAKFSAFIEEGLAKVLVLVPEFVRKNTADMITSVLKFLANLSGFRTLDEGAPLIGTRSC